MNKMIGTFFLVFATLCFSNAETGELIIDAIKNGDISKLRLATFDSGNINSFDSAGMGYIHYAAMYGGQRELDLLLKKGANINLQSRTKKRTPLLNIAVDADFNWDSIETMRAFYSAEIKKSVEVLNQLSILDDAKKIIDLCSSIKSMKRRMVRGW